MRTKNLYLSIIAISMLVILAACATNAAPGESTGQVLVPASSSAASSSQGGGTSQPPTSQTPDSQTPDSQTPETQPPATSSPTTQPPATQPPATQPPATQTPSTNPTATQAPATEPQDTTPPVTEPPVTGDGYVAPTNYEEYLALSGQNQAKFINSFENPADFALWLKNAKEVYENESGKIYIDGDTVVDLEEGK